MNSLNFVVRFFLTFVALVLPTVFIASYSLQDFRAEPFDFRQLSNTQYIAQRGATRKQEAEMKFGFAEASAPPEFGIFGNHQIQFYSSDAVPDGISFFNYWYADLTLLDQLDQIAYLKDKGKLPSKAILLSVTTPNNDNGRHILGRSIHLPQDVRGYAARARGQSAWLPDVQTWLVDQYADLRRGLDYATVASYLLVPATGYTIVDGAKCASPEKIGAELSSTLPSWAQRLPLPGAVRSDLHLLERFCRGDLFVQRKDGSTYDHRNRTPILNENPLNARESALQLGDEIEIAKILKALHDLIPPSVKYAILVPPVFETQRESSVDAIFSRTLALVPEVVVIDHRHKYRAAEYFIDYDHPNDRYFNLLTKELLERQILARRSD